MAPSTPIDSERLEELHIVRKVRETVRRWWGIELSFTDAAGHVVDHGKGIIIPPNNRICTTCLGDKQGLAACNGSIEDAVKRLSAEPTGVGPQGARMLGPCHMGLDIVAAPIESGGQRRGTLFACGFLVKETAERAREPALEGMRRLSLPVVGPDSAFDSVARIEGREVPRLTDLMATTVEEIAEVEQVVIERERKIHELRRELGGRYRFADIIGKSAQMQRLYQLLDKVVQSEVTVLITGENGTGKELVARAIHHNGPRKDKAFVAQNCAALNDNLLESELFGHLKGAFTGATRDKTGLLRVADGGTFFLDEVGDMSPAMQVKLLRVLQEGTFVPVGGTRPEKADVRIVAATDKDLRELVARRQFREDLFYRLHVLSIEVPPLRERIDDVPLLCEHFLEGFARRSGRAKKRLGPKVLAALYERSWPGNVRELENEIERLAVLAGDSEVIDAELVDHQPRSGAASSGAARAESLLLQGLEGGLQGAVEALERELIERGLRETNGNRSQLAHKLGVSRTTLLKKIRDFKLGPPGDGGEG